MRKRPPLAVARPIIPVAASGTRESILTRSGLPPRIPGNRHPDMNPDELALLAGIAAHADADLPRLVYADWLEERGFDRRAEFIRLQCEVAGKETLPRAALNAFVYLWKRQQELIDDHLPEILGPLAEPLAGARPRLRRGFVDELEMHVRDYLPLAERIAALRPTPSQVTVTNLLALPHELIRCPHLGAVTHLSLYDADHIDHPRTDDPPTREDVIAAVLRLDRLRGISLEGIPITDPYVGGPVEDHELPFPANLCEIDFSYCQMTDDVVISLLNAGLFRRLKRIILGGNPLTDQAAMELADRLGPVRTVEYLNLRFTGIGTAGQAALLAAFGSRVDLF